MDTYSISYTRPELRSTSRMYQDLNTCRPSAVRDLGRKPFFRPSTKMDAFNKLRIRGLNDTPHVAVIGAGLAGLRCADVLLQHGFRVTIIEGRDRVGGRVHQAKLPNGHTVDLGPNWIHGEGDNPILHIAHATGTTLAVPEQNPFMFDEDGKQLPPEDATFYSDRWWEIIQEAFEYSHDMGSVLDPSESLYDFAQKRTLKLFPDGETQTAQVEVERKRRTFLQVCEMWGAFIGSHVMRQSLKFFWLEECLEGANLFCAGTYSKILDAIAKPALEGASILYNTVVTRIETRQAPGTQVKLKTKDNRVLQFDEAVLTAPLGWLKQNLSAFEPPLPARLSDAICALGYGSLEKVYITFPTPWFSQPTDTGLKLAGDVEWVKPTYAPSNPNRWNQEAFELASFPDGTNHPTLLFYMYGDQSKHITSTLRGLPTQKAKDEFIFDFFKPYYSLLPHYDEAKPECRPSGWLSTDWLHDELAGNGSYTNFQVGLEAGDKDIEVMREGIPGRGLWLAGEHTAPFVACGTSTGAYWSGDSVAKRLAEAYGLVKKST